jgi:uncharacterized membrane protein
MHAAARRSPTARIVARWHGLAARIRAELSWNRIYRATSYARSALWIVPIVSIVLVLLVAPLLRALDASVTWRVTGLDVEGAKALFQTVITLTLSFIVFTFGSLLVALQVASGQLTPRIIATTLLRDNVVRYSVGIFVFTLLLAVMSLDRLQGQVHQLATLVVGTLGIACMVTFLFLIDYAARLLRPVSILTRVGGMGIEVVESVYQEALGGQDEDPAIPSSPGLPARIVTHDGASEVVLAVDLPTLVAEAGRLGGVIEVVPQVGEFLASGEPLFRLYGGAAGISRRKLQAAVALGAERTLEQDPMFAFRILVDIGLKALSPAINDPTTAVLALDQVHRLLRVVGRRRLRGDTVPGSDGALRVIFRTPDWEDYVHLACREIRVAGARQFQVARRLAAMLDDLARVLPEHRRAALVTERELLDRALPPLYGFEEDLALARVPDIQGMGGSPAGRLPAARNPP